MSRISSQIDHDRIVRSRPKPRNSIELISRTTNPQRTMATDGTQQGSDALYGQSAADLRRYVRSQLRNIKRGNDIEVEDVVQEAFLRFWTTAKPDEIKNAKGYLFRTAKNLIIDIGRRRSAQPIDSNVRTDEDYSQAIATVNLTPERFVSAKQDLDIARQTIGALPDKCRQAFCLQRYTGDTYAVVAKKLNMSESMVQKHMARALLALHKALP